MALLLTFLNPQGPRLRVVRTHIRNLAAVILVAACALSLTMLAQGVQKSSPRIDDPEVAALMQRVGTPSPLAIDEFKSAGMTEARAHVLTEAERAQVEAVLTSLPALNRRVLEKRLHSLAFVEGIPGEGTGLTSPVAETGTYDITLRASILGESLSNFLTTKEQRVFRDDGSGDTVTVRATGTDAVTYVLLHESTHVMDFVCGITKHPHNSFAAGVWASQQAMVPELATSLAAKTYFRRGAKIPLAQAVALYDALALTPFVSLYSTAEPQDDLAELVAWHEIQKEHHGELDITVTDAQGKTLGSWHPLSFPGVQKRFVNVDQLLASPQACSVLAGNNG